MEIVEKGWGREIIFANDEENDYCGKLLIFERRGTRDAKCSLHYHVKKHETWYFQEGQFNLITVDPKTGKKLIVSVFSPFVHVNTPGLAHQLICRTDRGVIFEVSTFDDPDDSYRVEPGDSQHA